MSRPYDASYPFQWRQGYWGCLSIAARLNRANRDQIRLIKNALAARGALQSGPLDDAKFAAAQRDVRMELTDYLAGIQRGLAEAKRRRDADRYAQQPVRQLQLGPIYICRRRDGRFILDIRTRWLNTRTCFGRGKA